MIISALLNAAVTAFKTLFGWIHLPCFPDDLLFSISNFLDLLFGNLSLLGLFCRVSTLKLAVPIVLIIVNFDKLYKIAMFTFNKLHK